MAKKTFYTKCGKVAFEKNSTAGVTRFEDINKNCNGCHFIETGTTKRGGKKIDIQFCQAGSQKPNMETTYSTCSMENTTCLDIIGLDMNAMKQIWEYARTLDGVFGKEIEFGKGVFHSVDRDDCRKSMPIEFLGNKKGKAAKKAIVERFFADKKNNCDDDQDPDDQDPEECRCDECNHVEKRSTEEPCKTCSESDGWPCFVPECPHKTAGCASMTCEKAKVSSSCCMDCDDPCNSRCGWADEVFEKPEICNDCGNNQDGCKPNDPDADQCASYEKDSAREQVNICPVPPRGETKPSEFSYSELDNETASFLQEKAQRITEIRIKSVMAMGKELKETFDKLSKVYGEKTKLFDQWVDSIGISGRHARRHIESYEWVIANCDNLELAEKIQPSLLFQISKPSAPVQLQEAVKSGDITTHKEYKELEAKLKETTESWKAVSEKSKELVQRNQEIVLENNTLKADLYKERHKGPPVRIVELEEELEKLKSQLRDETSHNEELQEAIRKKEQAIRELETRPIEVAVQEKEVFPADYESTKRSITYRDFMSIETILGQILSLQTEQIKNWAKQKLAEWDELEEDRFRQFHDDLINLVKVMEDYVINRKALKGGN